MFRSQTDDQLAARWDDEPWECSNGPDWHLTRHATPPQGVERSDYEPRVECIPSRDPLPYRYFNDFGEQLRAATFVTRPHALCEWVPRPEFDRPPVNRVLVAFRQDQASAQSWALSLAPEWIGPTFGETDWTPAEIEHARKVLTRLAAPVPASGS